MVDFLTASCPSTAKQAQIFTPLPAYLTASIGWWCLFLELYNGILVYFAISLSTAQSELNVNLPGRPPLERLWHRL